ncbi:MAG TPA: phosphotransferase [Candidatus Limnocylindria bacterium]|nr:phosphotransferase [Candidatus Limnocylindria bacterium]
MQGPRRWADELLVRPTVRRVLSGGGWEIRDLRRARSGTWIARVRSDAGHEGVLKLADSPAGARGLVRERDTLARLVRDDRLAEIHKLLPAVLDAGRQGRWSYILLRAVPGVPATASLLANPESVVTPASRVATRLHAATARQAIAGRPQLDEWVLGPLQAARQLLGDRLSAREHGVLDAVAADQSALLEGAMVRLGWIHGDLWSDNVLIDQDGGMITGLLDWDSATDAGLAVHDQLHLVLYSRKVAKGTEMGSEIVEALGGEPRWDVAELEALRAGTDGLPGSDAIARLRVGIILYWLRFVVGNLDRQPRATRRRRWVADNVSAVLASL